MANFELKLIMYTVLQNMNSGDTFTNRTNSTVTISKREIVNGREKYTQIKKLEPNEMYTATENFELAIQDFQSNPRYAIDEQPV